MSDIYDLFIIGGGINGCGIARDGAGRGLKVMLCEQDDLARGTSSASTKLIHGGLRYLEFYEFRLVREALMEREVIWGIAPHIVWPLRFVLPHHRGLRPAWLLRLGLFLYDHLGGRKALPATQTLNLTSHAAGEPLKPLFARGFEYSDCWVDDARLVALNAQDAAERGATIRTRTHVVSAHRQGDVWVIITQDKDSRARQEHRARMLVNAGGPWVADVIRDVVQVNAPAGVRLVQGSHIVVPKMFGHDRCYIFQNSDGRIIFAIPYENDFTLIGTTDQDFHGDVADVRASETEIEYLCAAASEYFRQPVLRSSVVWTYSGVRPLYDDGASKAQEATRDYVLTLDNDNGQPPLLSVFGGKITTYRRLAMSAFAKLDGYLSDAQRKRNNWTGGEPLPGGDFPKQNFLAQVEKLVAAHAFLSPAHARRLVRAYGTNAHRMIGDARALADLGQHFGATLYAQEVDYLMAHEFARCAADVVWRRTKLGLRMSEAEIAALDVYMQGMRDERRDQERSGAAS